VKEYAMSDTIPGSPYGRQPRSVLDGYSPIPYSRHVRGYGKGHDEVLVEEHEDGTVTLLPNDAAPYAWRRIWRRTPPPKERTR
jgi:hypothetical protein